MLDPTCIDPYYRRTVRVSMGEVLLLPVARAGAWPGDLGVLRAAGFETWALTPDPAADTDLVAGRRRHASRSCSAPRARACHRRALAAADRRVRIPIAPGVDSLNVGHAAAVAFAALSGRGRRRG